jgi:single-stranded DNA-binding protein
MERQSSISHAIKGSGAFLRIDVTDAFNRLGEFLADTLHKDDHVLVDGQLARSKQERGNGKS